MAVVLFGNTPLRRRTPEQIAREQQVADALLQNAESNAPIRTWTDGLGRVADAIAGVAKSRRAESELDAGRSMGTSAFNNDPDVQSLFGGGAPSGVAAPARGAESAQNATVAGPASTPRTEISNPDFVSSIAPAALEASQRTGVDPRIIVAQAALESGWGKHAPGNNLFGIKSHGQDGGNTLATTEVVNGQPVRTNASFRAYASPADSVSGYADFINENPRYAAFKAAQGLDGQIDALGASGYATDPNYAAKIRSIASGLPDLGAASPGVQRVAQATAGNNAGGLMALVNNPWLSDGQRAVVGALLKQKMERNDPSNQLDMDYKRAQIDALRNKGLPRSWSKLDDNTLFDATTGETRSVGTPGVGRPTERGLNPIYGVDKDGNPAVIQLGKDGTASQTVLPNGITLSKDPIKIDAGTNFVLIDPITRQPIATIPKDIAGAAAQEVIGKAKGEASAGLPDALAKAQNLLATIKSVEDDPGRERGTGLSSIFNAIPATQGYDFARKVDQLKGQAFLEAFNQLRGGGQITEIEGAKATDAIARLNTGQSEAAFAAALKDLRDVVEAGIGRLNAKAGAPAMPGAGSPEAPTAGGVKFERGPDGKLRRAR